MEKRAKIGYFAAANGYDGFRSYFGEIFNPENYTRLYVLKGGPGTGKSSLMRSVYSRFCESCNHAEVIHCSSDPDSLDGVILQNGNVCIAVIDGTAPHERDTVYPGAVDEIINLGSSWDTRWLEAKREDIFALNQEKREAYKAAYTYLSSAGQAKREIDKIKNSRFDYKSAKETAKTLAESIKKSNFGSVTTRLISAFGKSGKVRLDTINEISDTSYTISGDGHAASIFLSLLLEETKDSARVIRFPTPFDDKSCEALYYSDARLSFSVGGGADKEIDADEFIKTNSMSYERTRVLSELHDRSLEEAKRWFSIAADLHARLEKIYFEAMNFEKNDMVLAALNEDISSKLGS
mgnify:CR=1 FL=1